MSSSASMRQPPIATAKGTAVYVKLLLYYKFPGFLLSGGGPMPPILSPRAENKGKNYKVYAKTAQVNSSHTFASNDTCNFRFSKSQRSMT